jgi:FixJ family two-component response regulator
LVVHVVDDDEAVRDSMQALLESFGLNVRTYASAKEYLLTNPAPPCGCMLLDLHMPGMSGLELIDALHARGSKLPIIAITGRGDEGLKERVLRAGAMTLLDKPVADETLLSSLSHALSLGATAPGC